MKERSLIYLGVKSAIADLIWRVAFSWIGGEGARIRATIFHNRVQKEKVDAFARFIYSSGWHGMNCTINNQPHTITVQRT